MKRLGGVAGFAAALSVVLALTSVLHAQERGSGFTLIPGQVESLTGDRVVLKLFGDTLPSVGDLAMLGAHAAQSPGAPPESGWLVEHVEPPGVHLRKFGGAGAAKAGEPAVVYTTSVRSAEAYERNAALLGAVRNGDIVSVGAALDAGADVDMVGNSGRTALAEAARAGRRGIVKLLIDRGADPLARGFAGAGPIHEAADRAEADIVDALVAAGVPPDFPVATPLETDAMIDGATALHVAAMKDRHHVIRRLARHGATVDAVDSFGETPLGWTADTGATRSLRALLAFGADPDLSNGDGGRPLHWAAAEGHDDAVIALIAAGADPNAATGVGWLGNGNTALGIALTADRTETAALLLALGADPDIANADGKTAADIATAKGHDELAASLADPVELAGELRRFAGELLGKAAAEGRRTGLVEMLAAGISPDAVLDDGTPVLLAAVRTGDAATARLLLAAGADPDRRGADGRFALAEALIARNTDLARKVLLAGADPNATLGSIDPEAPGATPLALASRAGDSEIALALLTLGADPGIADATGRRPADHAAAAGAGDLAERLRQAAAVEPAVPERDPAAEANRLVVGALRAARQAGTAAGQEKAALLKSALADLTRIMDRYAETDLAVTIATNGAVGPFRFDDLRRQHADAVAASCGGDQTCAKSFDYEAPAGGGGGDGGANGLEIFWPIEPQAGDRAAVWRGVLAGVGGLDDATKIALIGDLAGYETDPSARTALKVLRHFGTFAGNKGLRDAAFAQNLALFQTLDALKYDLTLQANRRVNAARAGKPGIAYFLRVGSSGQRSLDWINWRRGIDWRTGDPADRVPPHDLSDMPNRDNYVENKLGNADDDLTNRAHPQDERTVPGIAEALNREASRAFLELTTELGTPIEPGQLAVEYLSPTQAYGVLKRIEPDNLLQSVPDYLEALVRSEPEKYNGLFTEEQLHAWGVEKGVVTQMQALAGGARGGQVDPLASTRAFAGSAAAELAGEQLFPKGVDDLAGWMANNYRQIFVVHDGTPKDIAKYTLRMLGYWSTFGLDAVADLQTHGHPLPAKYASAEGLRTLDAQLRALYTPETPEAYDDAIGALGGAAALGTLRDINRRVLMGGHRKHVSILAARLREGLVRHGAARADNPEAPPPTLSDLVGPVTDFRKNPLLMSLDTLAGAYGNLPEPVIEQLVADLGEDLQSLQDADGGTYDVEVRKYVLAALDEVRKGAAAVGREAAGFRSIAALRRSFDGEIEKHLRDIGGLDLDAEIIRLATGDMTRQRLRLVWDGNVPTVRWVDEQWTPADVAQDLQRTHGLMRELAWTEEATARRLAEAFAGDPPLAVQALRQLHRLFDVDDMPVRVVTYTDAAGNVVRKAIHPTRFVDPAMNLGVIMFKAGVKGGAAFQNAWGIWGDIGEASKLVQTIADMTVRSGLSDEDQRKALANGMASSISLVDRGVGLLKYAEFLATETTTPALVAHYGETLTALATLSGADTTSEEMALQLLQAGFKDLSLIVYPQLAPAYFLYGVYRWGAATLPTLAVNNDVVQLLVENGEWLLPEDRKGLPRLTGLKLGSGDAARVVSNTGDGPPVTQCLDPATREDLVRPSLLRWLTQRRPDRAFEDGIPLAGGENRGVRVRPREALIDLLHAQGYPEKDEVLSATRYAIERLPGSWTAQLTLMRWQTAKTWDADWLRRLGIVVPTRDDDRRVVEGPIRLAARSQSEGLTTRGFLDDAQDGVRKNFGYLVSQYWVQRQILMEGPILCGLYRQAAREAMKREMDGIETGFLEEVAKLDARLHDLDRRVWPEIARSADPVDGPKFDPDTHKPIADDFIRATQRHRDVLRRIETELGERAASDGPALPGTRAPPPEAVPDPARPDEPRTGDSLVPEPPTTSVGPSEITTAPADILDERALRGLGGDILAGLTDLAFRYEADYEEALRTLAGARKRVRSEGRIEGAADLDIHPYHVDLMGRGFLTELQQELPPPDGSMWTEAVAFAEASARLVGWLYNLPRPGDVAVRSARDLDDSYGTARNRATDDAAERIDRLMVLLAPETSSGAAASDGDPAAGMLARFGTDSREIARRHPYYASVVRLQNQVAKLEHLQRTLAAAEPDELRTAVRTMWRDWSRESDGGDAAAPEAAGTPAEAGTGTDRAPASDAAAADAAPTDEAGAAPADAGPPDIAGLAAAMQAEYRRRIALVESMFDLEIEIEPDSELAVSDHLKAAGKTTAIARLKGPAGAEIDRLVTGYWWQLWPTASSDPGEPECTYRSTERFEHTTLTRGREMLVPLREAGAFRLKVGAIGPDNVPLAAVERPVELDVAPARLAGEFRFDGERPGRDISLFLGPEGIEPPRARTMVRPRDLDESGAFVKPLCMLHRAEAPPPAEPAAAPAASPDAGRPPSPGAAAPRLAPLWAFAGIQTGIVLDPRSPPVAVRFKHRAPQDESAATEADRAEFRLAEPLRLLGADVRLVSVKVVDASGREIDAETAVSFRRGTLEGAGPHELRLEPGDRIAASANLETPAGTVSGKSEVLTFDPDEMKGELTLTVELEAYAAGNLTLAGTLVLPDSAEPPVTLSDGRIWSNIAPLLNVGGGAAFSLGNDRPVRLADGLRLTGLFFSADGRMLRVAGGEAEVELTQGTGDYQADVPLEIYEVTVRPVLVTVADVHGNPLPTDRTGVTFGGEPGSTEGDLFSGSVLLTRRDAAVPIRAVHQLPSGEEVSGERLFSAADVGDLLDPKPPAEPIEIRLPVHAGGLLRVVGSTRVETDGAPLPSKVSLEISAGDDPTVLAFEVEPGAPFELALPEPLKIGVGLDVEAEAESSGRIYRGAVDGTAVGAARVLDLGVIELKAATELVTVPDVRGETVAAAAATLDPLDLRLAVDEDRPDPTEPAARDLIFDQDRIGDTVPRGTAIPVKAHADIELVAVPNVVGAPVDDARAALSDAGFGVVDRPIENSDGEPGTVVTQVPAEWTRAGADILVGFRPGENPEGSAPDDVPLAGTWRGQLRLDNISVDGRGMPGHRFKAFVIDSFAKQFEKEKKEKEAEEQRRREEAERRRRSGEGGGVGEALGAIGEMPGAVMEGIAEGMGQAIAIGIAVYGGSMAELLSDGIEIGLAVVDEPESPGTYRLRMEGFVPVAEGDDDKGEIIDKVFDGVAAQAEAWDPKLAAETPDGPLVATKSISSDSASGGISLSLAPDLEKGVLDISISVSVRNTQPEPDDPIKSLKATLSGTLAPGPATTYPELKAAIGERLAAIATRVSAEAMKRFEPFLSDE